MLCCTASAVHSTPPPPGAGGRSPFPPSRSPAQSVKHRTCCIYQCNAFTFAERTAQLTPGKVRMHEKDLLICDGHRLLVGFFLGGGGAVGRAKLADYPFTNSGIFLSWLNMCLQVLQPHGGSTHPEFRNCHEVRHEERYSDGNPHCQGAPNGCTAESRVP